MQRSAKANKLNKLIPANENALAWNELSRTDWALLEIISSSLEIIVFQLLHKLNLNKSFLPGPREPHLNDPEKLKSIEEIWHNLFLQFQEKKADIDLMTLLEEQIIKFKEMQYAKFNERGKVVGNTTFFLKLQSALKKITIFIKKYSNKDHPLEINKWMYDKILNLITSSYQKFIVLLATQNVTDFSELKEHCETQLLFEEAIEQWCTFSKNKVDRSGCKIECSKILCDIALKTADNNGLISANKVFKRNIDAYLASLERTSLPHYAAIQIKLTNHYIYNCYMHMGNSINHAFYRNFIKAYKISKRHNNLDSLHVLQELLTNMINSLKDTSQENEFLYCLKMGKNILQKCKERIIKKISNPKYTKSVAFFKEQLEELSLANESFVTQENKIWEMKIREVVKVGKIKQQQIITTQQKEIIIQFDSLAEAFNYQLACQDENIRVKCEGNKIIFLSFRYAKSSKLQKAAQRYHASNNMAMVPHVTQHVEISGSNPSKQKVKTRGKQANLLAPVVSHTTDKRIDWNNDTSNLPVYHPHQEPKEVYKLNASFIKAYFFINKELSEALIEKRKAQQLKQVETLLANGQLWHGSGKGIIIKDKKIKIKDCSTDIRFFGEEVAVTMYRNKARHLYKINSFMTHKQKHPTVYNSNKAGK